MLTGTVHQARNLIGLNEVRYSPYVAVTPIDENGAKKKGKLKSKPAKRSLNPDWNFPFEIPLDFPAFKVQVADSVSEMFMGQVIFCNIDKDVEGEGWFRLQARVGKEESVGGEIQLSWKYKPNVFNINGALSGLGSVGPPLRFDIFLMVIKWLEEEAMETEGLFRLSGSDKEVKTLYAQFFDSSKLPVIPTDTDHHVVAGAMKLYLRETPVALIPVDYYKKWVNTIDEPSLDDKIASLKKFIDLLPLLHQNILVVLVGFLHRFSLHQRVNKMTPSNLGIVFGPTIVSVGPSSPTGNAGGFNLTTTAKESAVVEFFIENFYSIYDKEEETKRIELEESRRTSSLDEKKKMRVFTVFFPGGKKSVPYESCQDKKLLTILDRICVASSLNLTDHTVQDEQGLDVDWNLTIKDIVGTSVTMRETIRRSRRSKYRPEDVSGVTVGHSSQAPFADKTISIKSKPKTTTSGSGVSLSPKKDLNESKQRRNFMATVPVKPEKRPRSSTTSASASAAAAAAAAGGGSSLQMVGTSGVIPSMSTAPLLQTVTLEVSPIDQILDHLKGIQANVEIQNKKIDELTVRMEKFQKTCQRDSKQLDKHLKKLNSHRGIEGDDTRSKNKSQLLSKTKKFYRDKVTPSLAELSGDKSSDEKSAIENEAKSEDRSIIENEAKSEDRSVITLSVPNSSMRGGDEFDYD